MPRFCSTLCALLAFTSILQADNWPRFRGPNGDGVAEGQNIPVEFDATRGVLWKIPIPGVGNSCPIIWEGNLYLQTSTKKGSERVLLCLDAATGKVRWQQAFPASEFKVRGESSTASATAAVCADGVYIPIWNGKTVQMVAFTHDGRLLWSKDLGLWVSQHGTGSSPIIVGDKLIFAFDMDVKDMKGNVLPEGRPPSLMAFNTKTGALVWTTPREGYRACYSTPFLTSRNGAEELVVTSTMSIAGYDPKTGKETWTWDWEWAENNFKMPLRTVAASVLADGTLIATSGDGGGDRRMVALKLDKNGGTPTYVWGNGNKVFPYVPCPLARGSHVYFVTELGTIGCYEAKSGKETWRERLPDAKFFASPVMIDGKIYAPSMEGDVFVIAADAKYKLLARNTLGERFVSSPAVANGRLYLRGQNHLFCVGKSN